jgi:hypothetical protein
MSRYIISQSQLFDLVENFMSEQMAGGEVRKRDTDDYGNTRWDLYSKSGKFLMYYIHYGEKHMNGKVVENESGYLSLQHSLVSLFMRNLRFRQSKALDLLADWFTKTFEVDIDSVDIYMKHKYD